MFLAATTVRAQDRNFQIIGIVTDSITKEPLVSIYVTTGKLGAHP